jgi:hypothetical protein
LHQNYYRDFDPAVGRYLESDPIGLRGGINTYGYALASPIRRKDPLGLDVYVYDYYADVFGEGHVGIRVNNNGGGSCGCSSYGFYPLGQNAWRRVIEPADIDVRGAVLADVDAGPYNSLLIKTTPQQDAAVWKFILDRMRNPGTYNLYQRQCTDFVRDALRSAGIPVPSDDIIVPNNFFKALVPLIYNAGYSAP